MLASKVEMADELSDLYANYYHGESLAIKRSLSARASIDHIEEFHPQPLGRLIDVGAGNGAVLEEIDRRNLANEAAALEISATGIDGIRSRDLSIVKDVRQFDGYQIPYEDDAFDTAVCIHVLEHVEHERLFLREIGRIARDIFIEIPLEGGMRGRVNYKFGHINYYTPLSFKALLETSGLSIVKSKVVTSTLAYEQFVHGRWPGLLRFALRRSLLSLVGKHAPNLMTFLMIAHCRRTK